MEPMASPWSSRNKSITPGDNSDASKGKASPAQGCSEKSFSSKQTNVRKTKYAMAYERLQMEELRKTSLKQDELLLSEATAEFQHDWFRKFKMLDSDGGGTITAEDIVEWWVACQEMSLTSNAVADPAMVRKFERVISIFNKAKGHIQDMRMEELSYEGFLSLMQWDGQPCALITEAIAEDLERIRSIVKSCLESRRATMVVALTTNLHADLLQEADLTIYQRLNKFIEPVSTTVVCLNALILGVSIDHGVGWDGWAYVETAFVCFYVCELVFKMRASGLGTFFFGHEKFWNLLDVLIILSAIFDMLVQIVSMSEAGDGVENLAIVRLARVARLLRLVRLLRLKVFKEFKLMISGLVHGLRTLFWALVLFLVIVYFLALLFMLTVGSPESAPTHCDAMDEDCSVSRRVLAEQHNDMFGTLSRTMFTIFRCYTDGCTSMTGTPVVPMLGEVYGVGVVLIYVTSVFFITFGVFNVTTAIFVEQTMESAKRDRNKRAHAKQAETVRVAKTLQKLTLRICGVEPPDENTRATPSTKSGMHGKTQTVRRLAASTYAKLFNKHESLEDPIDTSEGKLVDSLTAPVTRERFFHHIKDPEIQDMIDDIDVSVSNLDCLFDILDADGSGQLEPRELVDGLMKLRGTSEKSDTVAALLGVRAVQKHMRDVHSLLIQNHKAVRTLSAALVPELKRIESLR